MNKKLEILWNKIKSFEMDDPESEFSFTDRLARENDWTLEYSIRAVFEYKKFMFLICTSGKSMTPSDQVDQVWHLHLLYTSSYWIDFCQNILKQNIHHGPTKGGQNEKSKFHDYYSETKDVYFNTFNEQPPEDIWPSSKVRFGEINYTRVNRHRKWVISKPRFFAKWKF